jgi:hypothetical protein
MERVARGEKLAFCRDVYGNQWIELRRGFIFRRCSKIEATPAEVAETRAMLRRRLRRRSPSLGGAPKAS